MNKSRVFRKQKIAVLLAVTFIMMALSGCSSTQADSADGDQESFRVHIANMGIPILLVVKEKGWLEEELGKIGGTVEWSNHPAGPPINEGIASKRIDLAVLGEGAVLSGAANQIDTKLVSLLTNGIEGVNYLIVPASSDIQSVEDLKGKKVGVNLGTSHHVFLLKVLSAAGLSQEDVKAVNLAITDAQPAFQTGQLDAWVTSDPFAEVEVNNNGARIITSGEALQIASPTFYVARGDFAKEHPEAVKVFLEVINQAIAFDKENHEEFIELAVKSSGRDRTLLETSSRKAGYQSSEISEDILTELQSSADILTDLGYLSKSIDVSTLPDNTYVTVIAK